MSVASWKKNALSYTSVDLCMKFHRNHIKTCYFFVLKIENKNAHTNLGKIGFGAEKSNEQYAQTSVSRSIMFVERVHMLPLHRIMSTNFTIADAHIHMINTHFWMPIKLACSSRVFVHSFIHISFFVSLLNQSDALLLHCMMTVNHKNISCHTFHV